MTRGFKWGRIIKMKNLDTYRHPIMGGDDVDDLIRQSYEELVGGDEGEMGLPEDILSPPTGFYDLNKRKKVRGYARPKKYVALSLDEIEPRID